MPFSRFNTYLVCWLKKYLLKECETNVLTEIYLKNILEKRGVWWKIFEPFFILEFKNIFIPL